VSWDDAIRLLREPWFLKTLAAAVLFFGVLLFTRRLRRVAAELERRKALADYVRGLDEFLRGDFRAAIDTLERVLERDPENVEARIALGDCYRETGDAAEAKKHHHHVHRVFGNELARNFLSLGKDELASWRAENVGFVFQTFNLIPVLTALENVELPLLLAGRAPKLRHERAREMLAAVGLETRMSHRPDQLSGGERQRVAIARAISMEPSVLLADEPTGNLDSKSGAEIVAIIEALNSENGIALLVVTHDGEIGRRAHRHLVMRDGKVFSDKRADREAAART